MFFLNPILQLSKHAWQERGGWCFWEGRWYPDAQYVVWNGLIQSETHWGLFIKYVRKIFRKTNISNPLIRTRTCAYQGVRNVSSSENFSYVLYGCPLIKNISTISHNVVLFQFYFWKVPTRLYCFICIILKE